MARLFISYKREEQDHAFAVRQWLIDRQGWAPEDIFVDLSSVHAGDEWEPAMLGEAERAEAMLFLASDAALGPDSFCLKELNRAKGVILTVTIKGLAPADERLHRALPPGAKVRQIAALDGQPTEPFPFVSPKDGTHGSANLNRRQVESIGDTLRDLGIAPNSFNWTPRAEGPYPGLHALQEGDEALFFGRDLEIRDGLKLFEGLAESVTNRALQIQAPSGAGKSSYLRAGLWRRLRNHAAFTPLAIIRVVGGALTHEDWGLAAGLAAPQANILKLAPAEIEARLAADPVALLQTIAEADAGEGGKRVLLLGIDQAEEMSALESSEARTELERLFEIVAAARNAGLDLRLVLTARDDSIDTVLDRLAASGIAQEQVESLRLHRMPAARFVDIIKGPAAAAERAGWPLIIPDDLTVDLAGAAAETQGEIGDSLPILALALQRLVKKHRAPDGRVSLPQSASAFIGSAVADAAQDAMASVGADEAALRQLIIPRLATWDPRAGEGGAAKRAVASEAELFRGDRAALKPLAEALVDQWLLTRSHLRGEAAYEVAHEALLRVAPLGDMIIELKDKFVRAEFLRLEAREWREASEDAERLARRGERLKEAEGLLADGDFGESLSDPKLGVAAYLKACRKKEKAETEEREALQTRELAAARRATNRTRAGLAVAVVLLAVSGYFGWNAFQQSQRAGAEAKRAEERLREAQINESRMLARASSRERREGDVGRAIALARLALPEDPVPSNDGSDRPITPEARQALFDTLHLSASLVPEAVLRGHEGSVYRALQLADGGLLTWSWDSTARLWDPDGRAGPVLRGHEDVVNGALQLADGRLLTWSWDRTARLWDPDGGAGPVLRGHEGRVDGALQLEDGRLLTWSEDNTARLWDAHGGAGPVLLGHEREVSGALQLEDGRLLTWSGDSTARLWDADGGAGPVLRGHEGGVSDALQLEDGRLLTWSLDSTARLWDADGRAGPVLRGHEDRVSGALQLADGQLLTWSRDSTARLWDPDGGAGPVLRGHEGGVSGALQLADGRLLTWSGGPFSSDNTARLWDADGGAGPVLRGHESGVDGALQLADGRLLTWSGQAARLWDPDGGAGPVLRGHEGGVDGALQLEDGRLLTWSRDNTARLWDADGGAGPVLRGHEVWVSGALQLDDGRLLTWSLDSTARLWDANGGAGPVLRGHEREVSGALQLADGQLLTWSRWSWDRTARLWDADGGAGPVLRGHEGRVDGALQLEDGRLLTWSVDSTARLWDPDGGAGPVLRGHEGGVDGALQLEDGGLLTWSGQAARLWDPDGGAGPVLRGHEGRVDGALQLEDGRLLTWSRDNTARLWPGDDAQLFAWADGVIERLDPLSVRNLCFDFQLSPEVCALAGDVNFTTDPVDALLRRGGQWLEAKDARADDAFDLAREAAATPERKGEVEAEIGRLRAEAAAQ